MAFELGNYKEVSERLGDLFEKYPDASLQPVSLAEPFQVITIGDKTFIAYGAACYRTPDDPRPSIGYAWEPFPGPTTYTKDSELQNAETSAWGRAIIACGASTAKHGIASANEVRNRQAQPAQAPAGSPRRPECAACGEVLTGKDTVQDPSGAYIHERCRG